MISIVSHQVSYFIAFYNSPYILQSIDIVYLIIWYMKYIVGICLFYKIINKYYS